jgi:phosphoribosylformylglycinamidine synthase
MNIGHPQRPEIMGQFVGAIQGMAVACRALDMPIVSGNVSLYNETKNDDGTGSAILPTPAIGGIGLLPDWSKSATIAFKAEGEAIFLVGAPGSHLGQSIWLREVAGREEGPPPPVDLAKEKAAGDFVRELIRAGKVTAVHDISDGGLLVAVAEMALAGNIGATIEGVADQAAAFGEDQGRYVVTTVDPDALAGAPVPLTRIGTTGGSVLAGASRAVPLDELRAAHEGFLPTLMGADAAFA